MEILWALPVGLAIGVLSGFFGVGGGFILTPILLILGFQPTTAIATSLLYTTSTSVSGTYAHLKLGNVLWKPAFILAASGVAATQIAHPLVLWLNQTGHAKVIISILYLMILAYFGISVFRDSKKKAAEKHAEGGVMKTILIGFFGGFASATLGVGGGFIMVPLLISFLGFDPRKAVGTSLLSIFFIVLAGFISYSFTTPINYILAAYFIIGALFGTAVGARLTSIFPTHKIKQLLSGLYAVTFISVLVKLVFNWATAGLFIIGLYAIFLFALFIIQSRQQRKSAH